MCITDEPITSRLSDMPFPSQLKNKVNVLRKLTGESQKLILLSTFYGLGKSL